MSKPIHIAVTGGAGQIAYQLYFALQVENFLDMINPLLCKFLKLPEALSALEGVKMELQDCAFPLLHDIRSDIRSL